MRSGFTLIELLIVVAIIGILSVSLLPTLSGSQGKARDAVRVASVKDAITAAETHQIDNYQYPTTDGCADTVFGSLYIKPPLPAIEGQACNYPFYYSLPDGHYVVSVQLELMQQANSCFNAISVAEASADTVDELIGEISDEPDCGEEDQPAYTVLR